MKKNYGFIALRILVFATSIGLALVISFVWHMKDNVKAASAGTTYNTITSPATRTVTYSAGTTNKLLTNEFAHWSPNNSSAIKSPDWDMTSGSLFSKNGSFWTGVPDSCEHVDALSKTCTNSNVFRANTKATFTGNTTVSMSLYQQAELHNINCSKTDSCWYGTHVWLRYVSQYNLYYASVNRADGKMVIKRKVPCGNDNGGTYFTLGSAVSHDFKTKQWSHYKTTIQTNSNGTVTINIFDTDTSKTVPVVSGTDSGGTNPNWSTSCTTPGKYSTAQYKPILSAGSVGVRGDYSNFLFKDFVVTENN